MMTVTALTGFYKKPFTFKLEYAIIIFRKFRSVFSKQQRQEVN